MSDRPAAPARFIVGIDLGTTHTVVAYADTADGGGRPDVRLFEVDQLVGAGQVAPRPMLASMRYHPAATELTPEQSAVPWGAYDPAQTSPPAVIGALAQELGGRVPGRLVASAKSWLCHPDVDRTANILPWGAPDDVAQVSPVAASASFLAHVRAAWDERHREHPLASQDVVLTVPASFDDAARQLTVRAAELAGLPTLRLVEEPQAAMYDWLWRHGASVSSDLAEVRLALVCDVGGGTSDLSLIRVELRDGTPRLTRVAVGDHLMLGGDNMDLALARLLEPRMARGGRLDAARLSALIQQSRAAKERLLAPEAPEQVPVTVLGGGRRLIGSAVSTELTREEVARTVLDGFFPRVPAAERPSRRQAAIREFGLPYVADPAVTRHVAAFLARHVEVARDALREQPDDSGVLVPDALLLNGGVFRAASLGRRLAEVLGEWRGAPLAELDNPEPELAVARGAAAYGLARREVGLRIGGGSPRAYFLLAGGKTRGSRTAVCLVPRGTDEGEEVELPERTFSLRLGRPVEFPLASTTTSHYHRPGALVDPEAEDLIALPPLAAVLESRRDEGSEREVSVRLAGQLTEVGTLELHAIAEEDRRRRWKLEFQVRGQAVESGGQTAATAVTELHPEFPRARERIQRVFAKSAAGVPARDVKGLRRDLERILGSRESWNPAVLRELFGVLWAGARRRRRSPDHERVWFNLAGYCLRPGYGYPLDEWRMNEIRPLWEQGVQYAKDLPVWSEWWTFWRRIAGGLDETAQQEVLAALEPRLRPGGRRRGKGKGQTAPEGALDAMVRLAGSLERLPARQKVDLAGWILPRARGERHAALAWWAVGRLGARVPFYGSAHAVVPPATAEGWLDELLGLDWRDTDGAAFAAVLLARASGDRERDVAAGLRERVAERVEQLGLPASWARMAREVVELEESDRRLVFGETLPPGLRLVG
jgi:molecular chaperone DnaK (HSP70)